MNRFCLDTPDGEHRISGSGAAATFLFEHGFADAEREPHWHLRWCLDRLETGEAMDVGLARVLCEATGV